MSRGTSILKAFMKLVLMNTPIFKQFANGFLQTQLTINKFNAVKNNMINGYPEIHQTSSQMNLQQLEDLAEIKKQLASLQQQLEEKQPK